MQHNILEHCHSLHGWPARRTVLVLVPHWRFNHISIVVCCYCQHIKQVEQSPNAGCTQYTRLPFSPCQKPLYWPKRLLMLSKGFSEGGEGRSGVASPSFFAALPASGTSGMRSLAELTPRSVPGACWPAVLGSGRFFMSMGDVICSATLELAGSSSLWVK